MPLNRRVRAILRTESGGVLLLKRLRSGIPPYWVAPGGGIEESDASPLAALEREVAEELGARITIEQRAFILEYLDPAGKGVRQEYYLCRLLEYDLARRSGPELSEAGRGEYIPAEVPLTRAALDPLNIRPDALKAYLLEIAAFP